MVLTKRLILAMLWLGEARGKSWFPTDDRAPCGLYQYLWVHRCSGGETKQEAARCHARHWTAFILNLEDSTPLPGDYPPRKLCVSGQAALTKCWGLTNSRHFCLTVLKTRIQDQRASTVRCGQEPSSWLQTADISHGRKRVRELCGVPFIRAPTPFMEPLPS